MSIYGTRLFGKVDAVPGIGHVATKCFHINFVPLVPTQGWLVTSQTGNGWRGVKIPISFKSYFVGLGRTLSIAGAVVGGVVLAIGLADVHKDPSMIGGGAALLVVGVFLFLGLRQASFINKASWSRVCRLAQLANLNDVAMAELAKAYGQSADSYGFTPPAATRAVAGGPPVVPVQPMVTSDPIQVESPVEVAPTAASPIRPLSESRRHG